MTDRARLVYNALPLESGGGGVSTYIRELLVQLGADLDAQLLAVVRPPGVDELPPEVTAVLRRESHGVRRALDGLVGFGPADLTHGLDVDLPLRRPGATVATVHDLAVFDVPWAFPRLRAVGERALVASSLRRADALIAVSAFTAERVRQRSGREATVVHSAPARTMAPPSTGEVARVRQRYCLPERFVLHVGNIEPRKDLVTLADACRVVEVPLVVTGQGLWGNRAPSGVLPVGSVPTADLPALYGAATLVGYASRYEGFGLPPIEAMACGAPVVSTPVPSVTEVARDGAAVFHAGDVDGLVALLRELLADGARRRELAARGATAVASLSWQRTAAATADVYRSVGLAV